MEKRLYHILTPVPPEELRNVNCLLVGAISIPQCVFKSQVSATPRGSPGGSQRASWGQVIVRELHTLLERLNKANGVSGWSQRPMAMNCHHSWPGAPW